MPTANKPLVHLTSRHRRAVALVGLAMIGIVTASGLYLRSSIASHPPASSETSIDRSIASVDPITYDFVSPSIGWAAMSPAGTSAALVLFRTTDGARHWTEQLVQKSAEVGPTSFQLQFIDPRRGFLAVGSPFANLYRTVDAGATWERVPLPGYTKNVDAIRFVDPNNGWLFSGNFPPVLYATHDAGNNWQPIVGVPTDGYGFALRDSSEGWLGSFATGIPHVYSSGEGGRAWQRHDLQAPPGTSWNGSSPTSAVLIHASIQLLPDSGAVAIVDTGTGMYDFETFDAGTTWSYLPSPPGIVGYEDALHWWAMKSTLLFKTSNAGKTWTMVSGSLPDWQFRPEVIDSTHAWAIIFGFGGWGLATTHDGGLHWQRGRVPQPH
jgi:photosystem II stability/assembly factor-like uncharacterized protein